ncbi:hypothetical protein O6P32_06775 [Phocaeicola sp. KGMB11183]|uniref:Uncharacterized protein n=1 Tax=Phocaeicola acetigenes TaxID=3016083 RepID=A0ABT4PH77_9BACT|nr:hypothetical protein [Phocaeicola sp. KGMB11183]MCZ8372413.1 hypothetical protein [Phocaeicola sp. KGMB11183]
MKMDFSSDMGINVDNDSTWQFKGRVLRVRTNHYGDISHIGYKLFDSSWASHYEARPLLDFIERYALEQDVKIEGIDKAEAASRKNVTFLQGDASLLKKITSEKMLRIKEVERRYYCVEWGEDSLRIKMNVPADYQVLVGANAIELEAIFERDLKRTSSLLFSNKLPENWKKGSFSYSEQFCIVSNGCYLSDEIRSDLYLNKKKDNGQEYVVLIDKAKPLQSITNILLTGCMNKDIPMMLTIDKYGYSKVKLEVSLQQVLRFFFQDGCSPYLGIKTYDGTVLTATLFALNSKMGYNHMLSLEVPMSILLEETGTIKGEVYVYTPLQNITEKFFTNDIRSNKP